MSFNIAVCAKQVVDPDTPLSGFQIDSTALSIIPAQGIPPVVNGYDENAVEAALKIKVSLVNVDNLLKDSLVLSKVREGIKKKDKEKTKRAGKEEKLEQAKSLASKVKIPGAKRIQSFWQKLRDFFINAGGYYTPPIRDMSNQFCRVIIQLKFNLCFF